MDIETELELFDNQVKESNLELLRAGCTVQPITEASGGQKGKHQHAKKTKKHARLKNLEADTLPEEYTLLDVHVYYSSI